MFAGERIRKIKVLLLEYHEIDVNTLCTVLSASVSTVRRDLDKLEMEGFLKRTHGGAILVDGLNNSDVEPLLEVCDDVLSVAALAAKMIVDGDQIFLGGGSICRAIASYLRESKWSGTVITNSIDVINELKNTEVAMIIIGGRVVVQGTKFVTDSQESVEELRNYVVNKAFISVTGFNEQHGFFGDSSVQADIYKVLKENALDVFVVVTEDKYQQIGMVRLGGMDMFKKIITNVNIPDGFKKYCMENGITLYTSFAR